MIFINIILVNKIQFLIIKKLFKCSSLFFNVICRFNPTIIEFKQHDIVGAIFLFRFKVCCTLKQTVLSALDFETVKIRFFIEIYRRKIAIPLISEVSINVLISILQSGWLSQGQIRYPGLG